VVLNSVILVVELVGGLRAHSLALLIDAAHNLSDQLALTCIWLAYVLAVSMSQRLQRAANLLNSLGLMAISGVLVWQAIDRALNPQPVVGWASMAVGLVAAAGNWAVARTLRDWRRTTPAIGLAYLHNLGDVHMSLAPVVAGGLVSLSGQPVFDPLVALGVGTWLFVTTARELRSSATDLLWPEDAVCPGHEHHELASA
jgi:cation diffusion facilitator family transporter